MPTWPGFGSPIFWESTIVVAPKTLTVELRKSDITAGTVIEVFRPLKGSRPRGSAHLIALLK